MIENKQLEINLLLDDINEITNSVLLYFTDPHHIWDQKELFFSVLSIDEKIFIIKFLLKELLKERND